MKRSCLFIFLALVLGCTKNKVAGRERNILNILFIGNSLTYINDVPALVKELGKLDSISIDYKTISGPNYGLDDHLAEGMVQQEIKTGKYDYVVVQQGPSALPESQANLMHAIAKYKALCKEFNTKLAVYMVWPFQSRLFDLDNVIFSYSKAGKTHSALICAAGLAWKIAWSIDSSLSLYGPDGFHPNMKGSLLAAMVIYGTLTGKYSFGNRQINNASWSKQVSAETMRTLKQASKEAIETKF
ncbi:hypothetical protein KACHI17_00070 [Sediminibacterium sp. KACHI17]|uniref:SGNH/GDSL hydrolase family protein n=1 Tax=Sediminibacterium sp. KACHI17 TaxID=1751071 RepID=A0AAT9GF18_9BACT